MVGCVRATMARLFARWGSACRDDLAGQSHRPPFVVTSREAFTRGPRRETCVRGRPEVKAGASPLRRFRRSGFPESRRPAASQRAQVRRHRSPEFKPRTMLPPSRRRWTRERFGDKRSPGRAQAADKALALTRRRATVAGAGGRASDARRSHDVSGRLARFAAERARGSRWHPARKCRSTAEVRARTSLGGRDRDLVLPQARGVGPG